MKGKNFLIPVLTAFLLIPEAVIPAAAQETSLREDPLSDRSESEKEIEYYDDTETYELRNFTVEELLALFDNSEDFTFVSLYQTASNQYTADYTVRGTFTGINGENIPVYWTTNMVMDTVTLNGTSYAHFVSFNLSTVTSLGSGSYNIYTKSNLKRDIINSGTILTMKQTLVLETTFGVSASVGLSAGWAQGSAAGSGTYYHRSPATTVSGQYALPLSNYVS